MTTPDSTTDRLGPIVEHGAQMAAVPAEAADIASKLVEQIVSGHLDAALEVVERGDGAFEDYSPHPIGIEGDARAIVAAVAPILLAQLQERLDTAEGQLRKVAALQCHPTDSDDELGWDDGYNAALAEARYLAAEVLPETIADRHYPQDLYLEFHEFPVQSSKRTVCVECSGHPVPWDFDEASLVLWPCKEAKALGLDGGDPDAEAQQHHTASPDSEMDPFEAADEAYRRWE